VGDLLSKLCPNGDIIDLGRDKTGYRVKFKSVELINKFVGRTFGTLNKQPFKLDRYSQRETVIFVMLDVGLHESRVRETLKEGEYLPKFAIRQCIMDGIISTKSYFVRSLLRSHISL
jgi:hypothetical protein